MTTPTREQVVQWAKEAADKVIVRGCINNDEATFQFALLARADLEAKIESQSEVIIGQGKRISYLENLTVECAKQEVDSQAKIESLQAELDNVKQVEFPRKAQAVADGWRKKIESLEAENARLNAEETHLDGCIANWKGSAQRLSQQLAESQAREQQLHETLPKSLSHFARYPEADAFSIKVTNDLLYSPFYDATLREREAFVKEGNK